MVKLDIQSIDSEFSQEKMETGLIDLVEASKLFGYTRHHLGLLCRQNKLKAKRVGKKWLTKKEWIEKYLIDVEEKYKKNKTHYTQLVPQNKKFEKPVILPVQDTERHIFEWSTVPPDTKPKRKGSSAPLKNVVAVSFIAILLGAYAFLGMYLAEGYPVIQGRVNQLVEGDFAGINQNLQALNGNVKNNYIEYSNNVVAVAMKLGYSYINADSQLVYFVNETKAQAKKKLSALADSYLADVDVENMQAVVMLKIRDLSYLIGTSIQKVVPSL